MNKAIITSIALTIAMICSACAGTDSAERDKAFLQEGSIVIARPAPEKSFFSADSLLGFLPVRAAHAGSWLSIDKEAGKLAVKNGTDTVAEFSAEGLDQLATGSFQIVHNQRNPLWYAPDSYFEARNLELPPEGDRARFRRGALGDFVIYLNKTTPIHAAPLWSTEVGGIRLTSDDISRLYYSLQVGDPIEVK